MATLSQKILAEAIGTAVLVIGGCGSAVFSAAFPGLGIGFLGVAFAFGLSLLAMAFTIGPISGCHVNPAVTIGLWAGGRFPIKEVPFYILAQVLGALIGAYVIYGIATGKPGFDVAAGSLAANGYGDHSPGGFNVGSAFIVEFVLTGLFVFVIMAATGARTPAGFAPIAIGLTLTLIHLISIPVTNTSVNPARSTGPALVALGWPVEQLWLFWVAPIGGAYTAGNIYKQLFARID